MSVTLLRSTSLLSSGSVSKNFPLSYFAGSFLFFRTCHLALDVSKYGRIRERMRVRATPSLRRAANRPLHLVNDEANSGNTTSRPNDGFDQGLCGVAPRLDRRSGWVG